MSGNCYNCGHRGHFARDCTEPRQERRREGNWRAPAREGGERSRSRSPTRDLEDRITRDRSPLRPSSPTATTAAVAPAAPVAHVKKGHNNLVIVKKGASVEAPDNTNKHEVEALKKEVTRLEMKLDLVRDDHRKEMERLNRALRLEFGDDWVY